MTDKHEMMHVRDRKGALEDALADLKRRGIPVLHFERAGGAIFFKVMRPKETAA